MAEQKSPSPRPVEAATAGPGEKRAAVRPSLAKASESGNPDVQQALGNLETARLNLEAVRAAGAGDPEAEDAVARAQAALAELGFE